MVTLVDQVMAAATVDSQGQCFCKGLSERPILHNLPICKIIRKGRSDKPLQEHWPCESTVAAAIT